MTSVNPANNNAATSFFYKTTSKSKPIEVNLQNDKIKNAQDQFTSRIQKKLTHAAEGGGKTYSFKNRFAKLNQTETATKPAPTASTPTANGANAISQHDAAKAQAKAPAITPENALSEAAQAKAHARAKTTSRPSVPVETTPPATSSALKEAAAEKKAAFTNAAVTGVTETAVEEGEDRLFTYDDLTSARDLIGARTGEENYHVEYDLDEDGEITFNDLVAMLFKYDSSSDPS